jgi:uncharacterized cysteine cluster protein YcgN (CxxCxxCC family)
MKTIITNSYRKLQTEASEIFVPTLCDGCGKSISALLPQVVQQEQGEKDIYCQKCQSFQHK